MARPISSVSSGEGTRAVVAKGPVLVAGASGFVGRAIVPRLARDGREVRALSRHPREAPGAENIVPVQGDVRDASSMRAALEGVETLVYLVHSMGGAKGGDFAARDREAARVTLQAAEAAGVRHIVYLGGLGAAGEGLSEHLASRQEVARVLEGGAPALTALRAAIIVGKGGSSWEMMRQLAARLPVMVCPQWVGSKCQPVALRDVVETIAAAVAFPEHAEGTFDVGGPDVLTYRQMMEIVGEELGRKPLIIEVPVLTPKLSAYWVDLVTDAPQPLAHALIEGLRNDVLVEGPTLDKLLPDPPMPFRRAVRVALGKEAAEAT